MEEMNIKKELSSFIMLRGMTWSASEEKVLLIAIEFIIEKIKEGKIKV